MIWGQGILVLFSNLRNQQKSKRLTDSQANTGATKDPYIDLLSYLRYANLREEGIFHVRRVDFLHAVRNEAEARGMGQQTMISQSFVDMGSVPTDFAIGRSRSSPMSTFNRKYEQYSDC